MRISPKISKVSSIEDSNKCSLLSADDNRSEEIPYEFCKVRVPYQYIIDLCLENKYLHIEKTKINSDLSKAMKDK